MLYLLLAITSWLIISRVFGNLRPHHIYVGVMYYFHVNVNWKGKVFLLHKDGMLVNGFREHVYKALNGVRQYADIG